MAATSTNTSSSTTTLEPGHIRETSPLLTDHDDLLQTSTCRFYTARHALAFIGFFGFFNAYCQRVNLSVALVAMVNTTENYNQLSEQCPGPYGGNTSSVSHSGEFDWDEKTQGHISGAFFYGYFVSMMPGGLLAGIYGGKHLFGVGMLFSSMCAVLTPMAARISVYCLIGVRVLQGIGQGVIFPSMHNILGNWATPWETTQLASFTYSGIILGTWFSMSISGLLCDSEIAGGWPSAFYLFGFLGCLWCYVWLMLVHNRPSEHPRMSRAEKEYLQSSIGERSKTKTPWRHIFSSPSVYAIFICTFCNNWFFYTLLTYLPTYMANILNFDIRMNGSLSGVPYLLSWVMTVASGITADWLIASGCMTANNTRKLMNTLGNLIPVLSLVMVGHVGCDHVLAMVFLCLSMSFQGCYTGAGGSINHLDIAPRFAGELMGMTNTFGTLTGVICPALVGYLTDGNQTRQQWQLIFYIAAAVNSFGAILYLVLAEGEEQWWAKPPTRQSIAHQVQSDLPNVISTHTSNTSSD